MKLNLIFFLKNISILEKNVLKKERGFFLSKLDCSCAVLSLKIDSNRHKKNKFLLKTLRNINVFFKNINFLKNRGVFFLNKFVLGFLEFFLKKKIFFTLKKGSNKVQMKQLSSRVFYTKFLKKKFKISKQILGLLFYMFLLKDPQIFILFLRKILEKNQIKTHKKILLGIKKLIKIYFLPIFYKIGLLGFFLNVKGKLGVSGNAKKRRYFYFFGKHTLTTKTTKLSHKFIPVWTYTGTLGLGLYLFF